MRVRSWFVGLVAALLLLTAASARAEEPAGIGQDAAHTAVVDDPSLGGAWRTRWRIHPPGDAHDVLADVSQVLVTGGRVLVWSSAFDGSYGGVTAYDATTGGQLWQRSLVAEAGLGNDGLSLLAAGDGRLYGVSRSGRMAAFDAATGALAWGPTPETAQYSYSDPPTYYGGRLFVMGQGSGATLYAYDARDGRALWEQDVPGGGRSAPAVGASGIYVHPEARPAAFTFDGRLRWQVGSGSGGDGANPVVSGGEVLSYDPYYERVEVRSASDGRPVTSLPVKALGPAVGPSLVVGLDADGGTLAAFRRPGYAPAWTYGQTSPYGGGSVVTEPLLVAGRAVVTTADGHLVALDPGDGHPTADLPLGAVPSGGTITSPTVVAGDGIIVARAYDGDLVAVEGAPAAPGADVPGGGAATTSTAQAPPPPTTTPTAPTTTAVPPPGPGVAPSAPTLVRLPPAAGSVRLLTARRLTAVRRGVRLAVRAPRSGARVAVELRAGSRTVARGATAVARAGTVRVRLGTPRRGSGRRTLRIVVAAPGATPVARTYALRG